MQNKNIKNLLLSASLISVSAVLTACGGGGGGNNSNSNSPNVDQQLPAINASVADLEQKLERIQEEKKGLEEQIRDLTKKQLFATSTENQTKIDLSLEQLKQNEIESYKVIAKLKQEQEATINSLTQQYLLEIEQIKQKNAELEAKSNTEIDQLKHQIAQLQREILERDDALETKQQLLQSSQQRLEQLQSHASSLRQQMSDSESTLNDLRSQLRSVQNQQTGGEQQLAQLRREVMSLRSVNLQKEAEISRLTVLNSQNNAQMEAYRASQQTINVLMQEKTSNEAKIVTLQRKIEVMQRQQDDSAKDLEELRAKVGSFEQTVQQKEDKIVQLTNTISSTETEKNLRETEIARLKAELDLRAKELSDLQTQQNSTNAEIAAQKELLVKQKMAAARALETVAAAEETTKNFMKQIEFLRMSLEADFNTTTSKAMTEYKSKSLEILHYFLSGNAVKFDKNYNSFVEKINTLKSVLKDFRGAKETELLANKEKIIEEMRLNKDQKISSAKQLKEQARNSVLKPITLQPELSQTSEYKGITDIIASIETTVSEFSIYATQQTFKTTTLLETFDNLRSEYYAIAEKNVKTLNDIKKKLNVYLTPKNDMFYINWYSQLGFNKQSLASETTGDLILGNEFNITSVVLCDPNGGPTQEIKNFFGRQLEAFQNGSVTIDDFVDKLIDSGIFHDVLYVRMGEEGGLIDLNKISNSPEFQDTSKRSTFIESIKKLMAFSLKTSRNDARYLRTLFSDTAEEAFHDLLKDFYEASISTQNSSMPPAATVALSAKTFRDISEKVSNRQARTAENGSVNLRGFNVNGAAGESIALGMPLFVQLKGDVSSSKSTEAATGSVAYRLGNTVMGAIQAYANSGEGFGVEGRQLETSIIASHSFGAFFIEGQIGTVSATDVHDSNWKGMRSQVTFGIDTEFVSPFVQVAHRQLDRGGIDLNQTTAYVGVDMDVAKFKADSYTVDTRLLAKVGYGDKAWSKGTNDLGKTSEFSGSVEWSGTLSLNSGVSFNASLNLDTTSKASASLQFRVEQ